MLENQRKERIIGLLTENTTMSTSELSKRLYVSDATVRRDLGDLERAGRIHRVHGGAELVSGPGIQIPLTARDRENDTAKRNIAAKAIRFVHDGDTIFLDASSTCMRVVPLLSVRTGLTVVTNSPKAILELAGMHIRTISTGGLLLISTNLSKAGSEKREKVKEWDLKKRSGKRSEPDYSRPSTG